MWRKWFQRKKFFSLFPHLLMLMMLKKKSFLSKRNVKRFGSAVSIYTQHPHTMRNPFSKCYFRYHIFSVNMLNVCWRQWRRKSERGEWERKIHIKKYFHIWNSYNFPCVPMNDIYFFALRFSLFCAFLCCFIFIIPVSQCLKIFLHPIHFIHL